MGGKRGGLESDKEEQTKETFEEVEEKQNEFNNLEAK